MQLLRQRSYVTPEAKAIKIWPQGQGLASRNTSLIVDIQSIHKVAQKVRPLFIAHIFN